MLKPRVVSKRYRNACCHPCVEAKIQCPTPSLSARLSLSPTLLPNAGRNSIQQVLALGYALNVRIWLKINQLKYYY